MMPSFTHNFEADPKCSDLSVDFDLPTKAVLGFTSDDGDIWVQANQAGWFHLARICAELGLRPEMGKGYHFHRTASWAQSAGPPEVSFEVIASEPV
jgi:hypothetical protein